MRTKEELLELAKMPLKPKSTIEAKLIYSGLVGVQSVLIEIRDILAEAFKEEILVKEAEKFEDMGEFEEAMKT